MAEIETLGILDEIQSIVSDKLQVVSYKWLSRNFLVSSNAAKRLLEEFVEKYGNGLEVIYSLSGWLKSNPSTYHIRLVSQQKLADAKQDFDGNCSIRVYSVQACLPKDPATLWNHEFVQAEDLFKQPPALDNCLRDNRFCGVLNSFVKRNASGAPSATLQVKPVGPKNYSSNKKTAVPLPQQNKDQHSKPNFGMQSMDTTKNVKTKNHAKLDQEQSADKEKFPQLLPNKKTGQSDNNSSGTGGALASMWGRASAKSKPDVPLVKGNSPQPCAATVDVQIFAREAVEYGSCDEEGQDFNIKRSSNGEGSRKRRVVLDYSDEEDEDQYAVNLASPDPPKKSAIDSKFSSRASGVGSNLNFVEGKENKPKIKEFKEVDVKNEQHFKGKATTISKEKKDEVPSSEKINDSKKDTYTKDIMPDAEPKRRKVMKTRIDERGREVTEVVWEGEEQDTKSDSNLVKTIENNSVNNAINRPPVSKKSPAVGLGAPANQAGKAGNKKAGNKDPKQGNILSFFKKV